MRQLAERALAQVGDNDLDWAPDYESNSVRAIIQHLHGNMMSRWTDFLTSDGEKPWRDRDGEFEPGDGLSREELMSRWEEGWACLFTALDGLTPENLSREITIRGQALTVIDAIHRQLAHYAYHVGQIVYIARIRASDRWRTLSIPKGESRQYQPREGD
jgi:hypothetical protein